MIRLLAACLALAACYPGAVRVGGPGALCAFPGDCGMGLICKRDDITRTCTHACSSNMDCEHGCCRLFEAGWFCSLEKCEEEMAMNGRTRR